jgi:hypothetical protein
LRERVLLGLAVVLAVVAVVENTRPRPHLEPPPRRVKPSRTTERLAAAGALTSSARPRRNIFEYGGAATPSIPAATPIALPESTPPPTSTPSPVKLVGLVQSQNGLRAALAVEGELLLGSRGEKVRGYTIVAIDADTGVVLNGPSGETLELRPPEPR